MKTDAQLKNDVLEERSWEPTVMEARAMARDAADNADLGTNDLIVSSIIRTNELQVWFLVEHVHSPIQPASVRHELFEPL